MLYVGLIRLTLHWLPAGEHFDMGHLVWPVCEHISVHIETYEEVLLCCFQEPDVPVEKVRRVKGQITNAVFRDYCIFLCVGVSQSSLAQLQQWD